MSYEGQIFVNKYKEEATVVQYNNRLDVVVKFTNGYVGSFQMGNLRRGNFRSPFAPTHCGVGYIGVGDFKPSVNRVKSKEYKIWCAMIERCYGKNSTLKLRGYESTMCEEWHNFQNFAKWYSENYYEVGEEKMCVDKDILIKGNTIYSPQTCCIVPNSINCLMMGSDSVRGEYPIGVSFREGHGYYARCNDGHNNTIMIGVYADPYSAFLAYKEYKENTIKQIATSLKEQLPYNVVEALMNYTVEITD